MIGIEGIADNPLATKRDMRLLFERLAAPLKPFYSEGGARLRLGETGASYEASVAEMEGFSRVLWGLVPLLAGGGDSELAALYPKGLANGTNPAHKEYWGEVRDYDQRLVEMAAIGFALAAAPERLWEPLTAEERRRLFDWLDQINRHPVYDCNWLFFRVLVNVGFRKAGLPYDEEQTEASLRRIGDYYLEEGWYADGVGGHSDYYVPFALHYYGLLYAKLMEREDPARAATYKERAAEFAKRFIHWFADDGSALPYGRSLAYRFSQSAFWSALSYAGADPFPPGVAKGIVLRNLRWWMKQPILDSNGLLTIGYAYPNLVMAENYNSPGSPYWAFKAFLPLALPDDHPFWTAEELPMPKLAELSVQRPAHLVLCRDQAGHAAAFNSGHRSTNEHTHTSAKYEKFVYSTAFAFSVSRAEWGLSQGAFDSMLALSEGDNLFRVRRKNEETAIRGNVLYAIWKPWPNVEVQTWLVAGLPWHLRIHRVASARSLDAAEGGFALGLAPGTNAEAEERRAAASGGANGTSAIVGLLGYARAELVYPNANTNLLHPRTVIPTLRASLEPGVHWLVSAVYGDPEGRMPAGEPPLGELRTSIGPDAIRIITVEGEAIELPRNGISSS
ncbi:DUF2264 domain-containing protein [Paenibacillus thailandensis]|uniref:DUF2264 domain-containing protein n=1 Tax=Paenibacillus thailandensis TaxID=393250 RepID=A0ABW5QW61_9BACL